MSEATKEFIWHYILPGGAILVALIVVVVLVAAFIASRSEDSLRYNYYMTKWRRRRWED